MRKVWLILLALLVPFGINAQGFSTTGSYSTEVVAPVGKTVTVTPLFGPIDINTGTAQLFTLPECGIPTDGGLSAYIVMSWKAFTGNFQLKHMFSYTETDTSATVVPEDSTTIFRNAMRIDSTMVKQNATLETVIVPVNVFGGAPMAGYYHLRIITNTVTDIENWSADLVVIY